LNGNTLFYSGGNIMKTRLYLLPIAGLLAAVLACNLSPATSATFSPSDIETLSAQTLVAIQWQTLMAQGTVPSQGGTTQVASAGPDDTATNTLLPSVTPTVFVPSLTYTPTTSSTPVPCNWSRFISDVTIPDNWETTPSDHFTKTWRLQNAGSCTWTSGYSLVFDHGDQMSAPAAQQLTPGTVAPGGTIDVSVNLVSPNIAGTYQGYFKLRASDSSIFGIGNDANTAFWVKIKVNAILAPPVIAPMTSQVYTQVTVAAGGVGPATATCPAGSVVVGGGFAAGSNMVVYTHSKEGNGWRAYAKNYSGSGQLLNAYAICLSNTSGSSQQVLKQITIAAGNIGYDTVDCPAGSVVTGGGFASNADSLWVYNSSKSGNGWSAYARNTSGTSQLLNIYGICLSGAGGSTSSVLKQVTLASGASNGDAAQCPAGNLVTGGGYALGTGLVVYNSSMKPSDPTKWNAFAKNTSGSSQLMNIYAICWALP
jgi:hypothetical protein